MLIKLGVVAHFGATGRFSVGIGLLGISLSLRFWCLIVFAAGKPLLLIWGDSTQLTNSKDVKAACRASSMGQRLILRLLIYNGLYWDILMGLIPLFFAHIQVKICSIV